jgi:homoserine dehydrogenase
VTPDLDPSDPVDSVAVPRQAAAGAGGSSASYRVGLLGHGTVGSALHELIESRAGAIQATTGIRPEVVGVLTRSRGDFDDICERSDLVVELIGGLDPAHDYILRALRAGKHVVTANKQVLAEHGEEIFDTARENGAQLRFEAAVGGVVPVIRVIHETLAAAHIERVHGIVNGTTNYILTEMARTGASYEDALRDAQELGYAEADPTDDVTGKDAAAKMAIIARLAFNARLTIDQVSYEGIRHITADDLSYAKELGLSLKLVGTAERRDGGISVRVHPAFLYAGHPLAAVNGSFNAVTIESPAITEITLSGPGAGGSQTASAVLGDVISTMIPPPTLPAPPVEQPIVTDVESAFYLSLDVADHPGVLARVAEILGLQGVSVKSVLQKGLGEDARLAMVMHPVLESRFHAAVEMIAGLDFVRTRPRVIRVIEETFE